MSDAFYLKYFYESYLHFFSLDKLLVGKYVYHNVHQKKKIPHENLYNWTNLQIASCESKNLHWKYFEDLC